VRKRKRSVYTAKRGDSTAFVGPTHATSAAPAGSATIIAVAAPSAHAVALSSAAASAGVAPTSAGGRVAKHDGRTTAGGVRVGSRTAATAASCASCMRKLPRTIDPEFF